VIATIALRSCEAQVMSRKNGTFDSIQAGRDEVGVSNNDVRIEVLECGPPSVQHLSLGHWKHAVESSTPIAD